MYSVKTVHSNRQWRKHYITLHYREPNTTKLH